jgi:serine/threonine-protein kinase
MLGDVGAGHVLGRYELLLPIASGGMATVWAARMKGSRGFQKIVAVKTMLPSVSDDPQFEQMFLDEATIASRIRHPNVAEILDLGEENGVLFLVMEWVDGESFSVVLKAAAKRGGVPKPVALRIIMSVCAGLHAAHELRDESANLRGVVHRDVSPQNILISFDGVVKIVDFGVAKAAGRTTSQTSAGQVKGKAAYMSPEQAQGAPIDRRTDVFAVGILLYQLTTGKHPFRGENEVATLYNICSEDPVTPPSTYVENYPPALEPVVMRALAKRADDRYATASELGRALDGVAREIGAATEEELASFLRDVLGDRQEKRNETLRVALRSADDRAAERPPTAIRDLETFSHTGFTPVTSVTAPGLGVLADAEATAPGSSRPTKPPQGPASEHAGGGTESGTVKARKPTPWLVSALVVTGGMALVGLGVVTFRHSRSAEAKKIVAPRAAASAPATPTDMPAIAHPSESASDQSATAAQALPAQRSEDESPSAAAGRAGAVAPVDSATSAAPSSSSKPSRAPGTGRAPGGAAVSSRRSAAHGGTPFVPPVRNPGF